MEERNSREQRNSREPGQRRRYRIVCSGRVQGVGFRYKAYHMAGLLGLTGWVKNLMSGSVEMEAQGTRAEVLKMLEMLRQDRYIYMDHVDMKEIPVEEEERSFKVRGY